MSVLMWIIIAFAFVGFNLYVTDTVHKMKEDMRLVKIRTGKIIHLLDSVLNQNSATTKTIKTNTTPLTEEVVVADTGADVDVVPEKERMAERASGLFQGVFGSLIGGGDTKQQSAPVAVAEDDESMDDILKRLKATIPKFK